MDCGLGLHVPPNPEREEQDKNISVKCFTNKQKNKTDNNNYDQLFNLTSSSDPDSQL